MSSNENIFLEENDEFKVEYEIINIEHSQDEEIKKYVKTKIQNIDSVIDINDLKLQEYNKQLKKFTNQADALDYTVAIGSGILAGIIDSFFVGDLTEAIKNLEKNHIPTDYYSLKPDKSISPCSHRLDDLAHHPTPIGLIASILTQFTKQGYFQNKEGEFFTILAEEHIGKNIGEKIFKGTIVWFFHLVSDVSTASGIPGPILSLAKEISMLPGINKTSLPKILNDIFTNKKNKFDLRAELGVLHQLGKQAIPVILNEVLVRVFYFLVD